jgi:hypothetical protein
MIENFQKSIRYADTSPTQVTVSLPRAELGHPDASWGDNSW